MSAAFTPGPWTQCDRVVVVTPQTHSYATWIANVSVGGMGAPEQLANARLIAEAPALYEAALEFVKWAEQSGHRAQPGSPVAKAREAIARVNGGAL